ncbi:MAG TPA: permease [Clostridia bacterium]|nr:permease [Clostridia bacterium]
MLEILKETINYVFSTLIHNAPSLILGILVASAIKVYVDPETMKKAIMKKAGISIPGSVAFGAFTPFCACGTMAIIVSMLTTALPWGPIMAFIVSSPLMSPDSFIMLSGIISIRFAAALAAASVIIGLSAGYITHYIEKNTGFLDNQARFHDSRVSSCGCSQITESCCSYSSAPIVESSGACGCSSAGAVSCCSKDAPVLSSFNQVTETYRLREFMNAVVDIGIKKVLLYFALFAAIGYFINQFVPAELILKYFSPDNIFAVPLSAIIGLPLYVSGSSSLPVINILLEGGASEGAMLAFMITGPGTSAGVIAGVATIMRRKALSLYIGYVLAGGIVLGYLYDLLLRFI